MLVCCVLIEWLNSQGLTMKKILYKNGLIKIMRNDIREMFLEVSQEKLTTTKLKLKDINVFKKFMSEGKTTIKFNTDKANLFINNAPPGLLMHFLKTIFVKLTKDSEDNKEVTKEQMHKKLREHLLSEKASKFDEISPITNAELDRAKKMTVSKATITTPSPPASRKRRLPDAKFNDNPKAAKKLYAPSPLSVKAENKQMSLKPEDAAVLEKLNEEQNQILQGKLNSNFLVSIYVQHIYFSMCWWTKRFFHWFCRNRQIISVAQNHFNLPSRWNCCYSINWSCSLSYWWCYLAFICWHRSWRS